MSYIGVQPTAGQYRKLDDISGSFNGSATTFTTQVGSQNVSAGTAQQLLVSLGGVIQNPITDYTVSTNSITFTTAPAAGLSFFAVLMGEAVNTGTPSDGVVTGAKLSAPFNYNSGLLYLDSSNNRVGVGTASASTILHVASTAPYIRIQDTDSNTGVTAQGGFEMYDSDGDRLFYLANESSSSADVGLFNMAGGALKFGTSGSERGQFDSSGRLLVGTSSGRTVGAVAGSIQIEGVTDTGLSITDNSNGSAGDSTWLTLARTRGTAVGGTTAVSNGDWLGNLDFAGHNGSSFNVAARISGQVDGAVSGGGVGDMPGRLVFSTTADGASSPTERMRIGSDGRTNILDASTEGFASRSTSGASTGLNLYSGWHSATTVLNGTAVYVVRTNGNVLNTNGSYTTLSDVKLKENIADASSQWADIKGIKIRNWNFKEETGYETHRQIGPIAQELETVCPGLVSESPDRDFDGNDLGTTTKSVNQSVLYMKAVKALQEAMERIEQLEAKVAALESA